MTNQTNIFYFVTASLLLHVLVLSFSPAEAQTEWRKLNPGEYEWHPEIAPSGPLLVICSIDDQILYLYRNGRLIGRSTISTGKPGHETPTGVFSVLQRKVDHVSNIYKGARMPYMQRLTWSGIAMHAGNLPGYPASAGCIRMPYEFSQLLYDAMEMGATVVIAKRKTQPSRSSTPANILLSSKAITDSYRAAPKGQTFWRPGKSRSGAMGILLSYADRTMYVWRNGVQIGQTPFDYNFGDETPVEGVFVRLEDDSGIAPKPVKRKSIFKSKNETPAIEYNWATVSLQSDVNVVGLKERMDRALHIPPAFAEKLVPLLGPGTLFVATSDHSSSKTRSVAPMAIATPLAPRE